MSVDHIDDQLPLATSDLDHRTEARHARGAPAQSLGEDLPRVVIVEGGSTDTFEELLLGVASGDQQALAVLKDRLGGLVRVNIRRVLGDASRADAVTQEFFAEVLRDASDFDPDRHSAQAWLLSRAHHRAIDELRSGHSAVGSGATRIDQHEPAWSL